VEFSGGRRRRWGGYVLEFGFKPGFDAFVRNFAKAAVKGGSETVAEFVGELADRLLIFGGKVFDPFENGRERTVFSGYGIAKIVYLLLGCERGDLGGNVGFEGLELGNQRT
jgi:hypothetical protein